MNKKSLKAFAVTAMSVLALACAKEPASEVGGETGVSFSIDVPGVPATKANGDGLVATKLYYQVFDAEGAVIEGLGVQNTTIVDKHAKVNFTLVKGQTYNFVFWAQTEAEGYYTIDPVAGLKKITANYAEKNCNDENFDAFYAVEEIEVAGPVSATVTLKRPFAQINFATEGTIKAGSASREIDFTDAASTVTVKGIPTVFSPLADEKFSEVATAVTFAKSASPAGTIKVAGKDYKYLAVNYVFAPVEGTVYDLSAKLTVEGKEVAMSVPAAPAKQNWRTNIVGNLLTAEAGFDVVTDPDFDGDEDLKLFFVNGVGYKTFDEAVNAVPTTGEETIIEVSQNISGNGVRTVNGQNVVIDLGGNTFNIDGETVGSSGSPTNGLQLLKGSKVTIKNGTIKSTKAYILIQNYCDLTLEDVTLDASECTADKAGTYVLSNNHGTVKLLGSTSIYSRAGMFAFDVCYWAPAYEDGVNVYVNTTGVIDGAIEYSCARAVDEEASRTLSSLVIDNAVLKNSSFKTTLASPNIKVASSLFADETAANAWVPSGYEVLKLGEYYKVVKAGSVVSSDADLRTVFNDAATAGDAVTINLAEGTFNWPDSKSDSDVKFPKTINIIGVDKESSFVKFNAGSYPENCDVNLENVTIDNAVGCNYDEFSLAQMVRVNNVNVKNCIIKNQFRILAHGTVTISDCKFSNGNSKGFDGYCLNYYGYDGSKVIVKKCTFDTVQKAIVMYSEGHSKDYNLEVSDCTFTASNSSTDKAAIQMHTEYGIKGNLKISNCSATGFKTNSLSPEGLWWEGNNGNNTPTKNFTIVVDGETVQTAVQTAE